ncbi:hypothetical protein AGMMS50293_10180 [Spirochaetia bacterium]|nr:hypothetical protein AGMMS50293_10180 [Spirochaetia bacterium]
MMTQRYFKKRTLLFLIMAALFTFPLAAQTAADMDRLLESPAVSWGEAATFILAAADKGQGLSEEAAFRLAGELAKLPRNAAAEKPVTLGGASLIIMKAFNLQSGLYRLFPNGHYACRELVYLGVIQGKSDPDMRVSGERLLRILGRVLDYTGADGGDYE